MLLLDFDEIQSCSDAELLRLFRVSILRNRKGRLDNRIECILSEIRRRVDNGLLNTPILSETLDHVKSKFKC